MQCYSEQQNSMNVMHHMAQMMLQRIGRGADGGGAAPPLALYSVSCKLHVKLSDDGFGYTVSTYQGVYPDVFLVSGLAYAFDITSPGNPFAICSADTAEPLTGEGGHMFAHVSPDGAVTSGDAANEGHESGTLIWTVPANFNGAVYRSLGLGGSGKIHVVNIANLVSP